MPIYQMTKDSWGLSLNGVITAFENPNNEKYVVVMSLLFELPDGSAIVPPESPPPFLSPTHKFVYEFLCIRNTYMNSVCLKNFREKCRMAELVYFYGYSLS